MQLRSIEIVWAANRAYYKVGMQGCSAILFDLTKNILYIDFVDGTKDNVNLNNVVSFNYEVAPAD